MGKQNAIMLDEKGIYIDGKYQVLLASSLFYFRIPEERWDMRMKLLKTAGYNTIDVYLPWNYHETAPGVWNFRGNRDVAAFLRLAAENNLYVILRPGPYICSEWDGGALPAWLGAKKVAVRQDDNEFLRLAGNWYEQVLPLVRPYQITENGTVICMQIENELDFFKCNSPVSYMEKLSGRVKDSGIGIPLFYCCGQNDMLRGGGLTPGLYTAYNVYGDAAQTGLEERALHLYTTVQERKMPLLVTETNREHSFLKRLLACGAKLLSPYNQTAGTTTDWYNGLTNWGSDKEPLSLLTSDYDFQSMIGSAGEAGEEFYQARLLAGLLLSLPVEMGEARPEPPAGEWIISDGAANSALAVLGTKRGKFLAVSNLGEAGEMKLHTGDGIFTLAMPAYYTKLLPVSLKLSAKEDIILCASSYELAYLMEADGLITAGFYGEGLFQALVSIKGKKTLLSCTPGDEAECLFFSSLKLVAGTVRAMAMSHVPGLPDMSGAVEDQPVSYGVTKICRVSCGLPSSTEYETSVMPMEKLGQYRGVGCYRILLEVDSHVMIQDAGDIITIEGEGVAETLFSRGGTLERIWHKGEYRICAEIWGHSNFDDIRCKSLRMSSLKGISNIIQVKSRQDISDNWLFELDEQPVSEWYFFRHSGYNTIMGIDAYIRASTPLRTVYDKWVTVSETDTSHVLHFSAADCLIYVYVNGHYEGTVIKDDPYLDISRYAGSSRIQITLRLERRYHSDKAGDVTLISGVKIPSCHYREVPIEELSMNTEGECVKLPMPLSRGTHTLLKIPLKAKKGKDIKVFFKGQDIKLTVIWNHRIVGRLILETQGFPVMKGGRSDVVCLCSEWLEKEEPVIWCQSIGVNPVLEEVTVVEYGSVISSVCSVSSIL